MPRLPGARPRDARGAGLAAPLLEVVLPRLVNALVERADVVLVLDDFHRLSSASTRDERRVVRRAPARVGAARAVHPHRSGAARSARCARTGSCSSCARTSCASRCAEADEFLNGRLGARPRRRPTSTCSSRGPRAGRRASTSRRCRWRARRTSTALVHGVRRHERARRRLPRERGARGATSPELQTFMLRTSVLERLCAPLCDAVLERADVGRRARVAGALEPVPAAARRPARMVSLPPPVRPDPARRARAARARDRGPGAASARVTVAQRVRHDRRGDPPRRRGRRVRRGRAS